MKLISKNSQFFSELSAIADNYPNLTVLELDKTAPAQNLSELSGHIHIAENCENIDSLQHIVESKCTALVHKENPDYLEDFKRSARISENPQDYFHKPERLIFETPARIVKVPFQNTVDKGTALTEVDNYCNLLNSPFLTESLQALFEELFMNAVFDAPREAGSQEDPFPAELMIADDGNTLVISCLDRYGSLKTEKLFNRMLLIEKQGAGQVMNMDSALGGAGIGCSIIFGCSASLIVGVTPGKYTRVSCIIPLKTSRKKFGLLKKNIQIVKI